jgi:hypothetical protein
MSPEMVVPPGSGIPAKIPVKVFIWTIREEPRLAPATSWQNTEGRLHGASRWNRLFLVRAPDLIVHESFGSEERLFCCSKGHECFVVPKCRNVLLFRNNPPPRLKFASDSGNPRPMGTSRYANRYIRAAPPLRSSTVRNLERGFSLAACFSGKLGSAPPAAASPL